MLAIAPTDINWFNFFYTKSPPSLVNFWTPTPWNVRQLKERDHLLFLLKSPYRKIAGYGTFKYYENLTANDAWSKYGIGNGCSNLNELVQRATGYARIHSTKPNTYENTNPVIGCIVLENPIFLDEGDFVKPEDVGLSFAPQVVKLKYFNTTLDQVIGVTMLQNNDPFQLVDSKAGSKKKVTVKERKGQSSFRKNVLLAYNNTCAVSGEDCSEILEAAHIQPYVNEESNHIQNGICLRSDLHKLFDAGLLSIDANNKVVLSEHLFSNYYRSFNGKNIALPLNPKERPSKEAFNFHFSSIFRG
ncbi:HNH endonuclease [Priestia megaterium]|uniref:HNH endonuclease n=1 Tax=Priestia megaterium TaxID=1404 RepID=UPI003C2F16EE